MRFMPNFKQETKYSITYAIYMLSVTVITFVIIFAMQITPYELDKLVKLLWTFMLFGLCWGAEDIVGFFVPQHKYD